jgi:uncharacterized membrane protein YecN with MAPEG domain
MPLPVTALYAALSALLLLLLAFRVVQARWKYKTSLGTGTEPGMERAVRVHANFVEYVPLALLLMGLAEANGAPAAGLHAAGAVLLASRVLHAWGLSKVSGRSFGRFYGTAGTWLTLLLLALGNLLLLAGFGG